MHVYKKYEKYSPGRHLYQMIYNLRIGGAVGCLTKSLTGRNVLTGPCAGGRCMGSQPGPEGSYVAEWRSMTLLKILCLGVHLCGVLLAT